MLQAIRLPTMDIALSRASGMAVAVYGGLGVATGLAVWHYDAPSVFLLLLAFLWNGVHQSRLGVFTLFLGYFAAGAVDIVDISKQFFDGISWISSIAIWLGHAAILALPFVLLWKAKVSALSAAVRYMAALLIVSAPPIGILGWLSPILAAGALFPGTGVAGLFATLVISGALAGAMPSKEYRIGFLVLYTVSIVMNMAWADREPQPPMTWFAQNTHMGRYPDNIESQIERQQRLTGMAIEAIEGGAKVILMPEEIVGIWNASTRYIWETKVAPIAKAHDATVLVGAAVKGEGRKEINAIVAIGQDQFTHGARQPMPVSMWRPWAKDGYAAEWNSGVKAVQGTKAAITLCYEDFLIWPTATAFILDKPQIILSAANNWFGGSLSAREIQRRSIALQGRLYGVPVVRAVNAD